MDTEIRVKYGELIRAVRAMQHTIKDYPDVFFDADDYDAYRCVKTEMNTVFNSAERLGDWVRTLDEEQCKKALARLIEI